MNKLKEFLEKPISHQTYKNFRDAVDGDCPSGITINPILDRNEDFDRSKL